MKIILLFLFFIVAQFHNYGQDTVAFKPTVMEPSNIPKSNAAKYIVDPSIKDSVNFYVKTDDNPSYQLMTIGRKKGAKNNSLSGLFAFSSYLSGDTSIVMIFPKQSASGGFRINIIGDSSKCFHFIMGFGQEDTGGFLKLYKTDSTYKNELLVPPTTCKLILSKEPEFREGEIIEGYLEFESQVYYYKKETKDKKSSDGKMQWYISGYFRTFDSKKLMAN